MDLGSSRLGLLLNIGIRAGVAGGKGGWGGAAAPQKFWATQIVWSARKIWAKPVFKDVFKLFC